jgi:hypothetical protein
MRDRQEVLDRYRELSARHLAERREQYLGRRPINCVNNVRLRVRGKGQLGFCQNPLVLAKCGLKMFVCNENFTAERCKVFCCKSTLESVDREFGEVLASPSRCGNDYPKLAMLIWFLQDFETHGRSGRFSQLLRKLGNSLWGLIAFRWW